MIMMLHETCRFSNYLYTNNQLLCLDVGKENLKCLLGSNLSR